MKNNTNQKTVIFFMLLAMGLIIIFLWCQGSEKEVKEVSPREEAKEALLNEIMDGEDNNG